MAKSNRTIQKITHPLYSHPVWFMSVFFVVIFLVFSTQYYQGELHRYSMASVCAFSLLNLITPLIAIYLHKTFLSFQGITIVVAGANQKKWFLHEKSLIFEINIWSIVTAIFTALGGVIMNYYAADWFWTGAAKFFYYLHVVMLYSALGTLGWTYLGILLFAFRLRYIRLDTEPLETKKDEFQTISSLFWRIFLTGVILYLGATMAVSLAPLDYIRKISLFQYLIFPLAIIVTCYFILIQYFLHEVMKKNKRNRLYKISQFTEEYYFRWKKSRLVSHRATINDLLGWKDRIEKEKDFPFSFFTVAFVFLAMFFLPMIILIISLY